MVLLHKTLAVLFCQWYRLEGCLLHGAWQDKRTTHFNPMVVWYRHTMVLEPVAGCVACFMQGLLTECINADVYLTEVHCDVTSVALAIF